MKTLVRWVGLLLVVLLLLLVAVPLLLYTPHVQGMATRWAAARLTEHTALEIGVGSVHLKYPFRLEIERLQVGRQLSINHLSTSIRLRPLLKSSISADHITIDGIAFYTEPHTYLSAQEFKIEEVSYHWRSRKAHIRHILLAGGDVALHASTPRHAPDTLFHKFPLLLTIADVQLSHIKASYSSAQLTLSSALHSLALQHIAIDTAMHISLRSADLRVESVNITPEGQSPWTLAQFEAHANSLCYTPQHIAGELTHLALTTPYGMNLLDGAASFTLDDNTLTLPYFTFHTAHSSFSGHLRTESHMADHLIVDGDADIRIGYTDALFLAERIGNISPEVISLYPTHDLYVSLALKGSTEQLYLSRCQLSLPTAFDIKLSGYAQALTTPQERAAQCRFEADTHDLEFLNALLAGSALHLPSKMTCRGDLHYTPDTMYTRCLISLDRGSAMIEAGLAPTSRSYTLYLQTDSLDLHRIMPRTELGIASLHAHITGRGTDFDDDATTLRGTLRLHTLQWSRHTFTHLSTQISIANRCLHAHASCNDSLMQWTMTASIRHTPDTLEAQLHAQVAHLDLKALRLTDTDILPAIQCQATLTASPGVSYALHAQFSDITLSTPSQHISSRPLTLTGTLTPDTALLALHTGDLTLLANAHAEGFPWQWPGSDISPSALPYWHATLKAGADNPVSNYLSLMGIDTDSIGGEAHYADRTLRLRLQSGLLRWHTPAMSLQGIASCSLAWVDDFAPSGLTGHLYLSSVRYALPAYGLQLHTMSTLSIPFAQSVLTLNALPLYTTDSQPLLLNGSITLLGGMPTLRLRLTSTGTNLLHPQAPRSGMLYGTAIVSSDIMIVGPVDALSITGDLRLLPGSSIHYIYKDVILTSGNQLDRVVTFVSFDADTPPLPRLRAATSDLSVSLTIAIDPTVQIEVTLGASQHSSATMQGGGVLTLQYTPTVGLRIAGRYTIEQGELDMNVPLLHVSHMAIRTGSTITWEGNPLNPQLAITAEERIRASVTLDGSPQSVLFVAGISLSDTMERLNVQFTLSAPENASMQNTLATLSPDERGKLSVALLTTGLYLGEGGTGSLMNTALMGMLQAQLDNISRDAFRTVDVSVGIEPLPDGVSGVSTRTDYSFSVAKRLWNNRIRIIIGGRVTTSNERIEDDAVINNISLEWRITPMGNQYLRFFYDTNYESILEGEIRETGVGYGLKRNF